MKLLILFLALLILPGCEEAKTIQEGTAESYWPPSTENVIVLEEDKAVYTCDVCGKEFGGYIGVMIDHLGSAEKDKNAIHSYSPYPIKKYVICFGCWLNSMGVKEPK